MAVTAFKSPVTGLWPLGAVTVATAGTAVPLNTNVGPQTEGPGLRPSGNVRQLVFMCPTTGNTGLVYILRNQKGQTVSKATPLVVVGIIGPGQTLSLPNGSMGLSSAVNIDDYSVDADTSANVVYTTAVVG